MAKPKKCDDGIETEITFTVKVTRYQPKDGHGRLYMSAGGGDWKGADGLHGRVEMPVGSMSPIVTVQGSGDAFEEIYTFDPQSMIAAAVAAYRKDR
jgi:hypothetical protein